MEVCVGGEGLDDGFADAADGLDARAGEGGCDLDSGDLKVCGLPLVQTRTMRAPWTRAWTPVAMVSTSGSSGIGNRVMRPALQWPGKEAV